MLFVQKIYLTEITEIARVYSDIFFFSPSKGSGGGLRNHGGLRPWSRPQVASFLHVVLRHYGEVDEVVVGEVLHVV